jgi:hypothetical protein
MINFLIFAYIVIALALAAIVWFGRNRKLDSKFKKTTGLLKALWSGAIWFWVAAVFLWEYARARSKTFRG